MRIGIVAGELSGDILGAGVVRALRARYPHAIFEGIAGPRMLAEGVVSLYPMERLAVMGLVEPLKRLPELLQLRAGLRRHFLAHPPAVFIGIDSPDFNLSLEGQLKAAGIPAVHYVSPSVWAWRQKRIHKIAASVDLMLTLFPFEEAFYRLHGVQVACVGHPLADELPLTVDVVGARARLGLNTDQPVVALLPGSRRNEVAKLGALFLDVAAKCVARKPGLSFLIPAATPERHAELQALLHARGDNLPVQLLQGDSHSAMAAADVVLMASGTVALEAMMLKKPMVVAYKLAELSYRILKRIVKIEHISLPNLLAGRTLVPEYIQHDATPEALADAVMERLENRSLGQSLQADFMAMHQLLRRDASEAAAEAISQLIGARRRG